MHFNRLRLAQFISKVNRWNVSAILTSIRLALLLLAYVLIEHINSHNFIYYFPSGNRLFARRKFFQFEVR